MIESEKEKSDRKQTRATIGQVLSGSAKPFWFPLQNSPKGESRGDVVVLDSWSTRKVLISFAWLPRIIRRSDFSSRRTCVSIQFDDGRRLALSHLSTEWAKIPEGILCAVKIQSNSLRSAANSE